MAKPNPHSALRTPHLKRLVPLLLDWFAANARDLPWRRTRDPYAIWVSEIMLQQTQVRTVIPFWNRWMRELPTIEAAAKASPAKIHKLWEGLGYYTRARNLQKAAQQIVNRRRDEFHESPFKNKVRDSQRSSLRFPEKFEDVLVLPGIGRYTAGAICSIAFNQPTPILDGNVIRVLTRIFGIGGNPKEKETNARLWKLAEELVKEANKGRDSALRCPDAAARHPYHCSYFNQSLMELGALVCTPRNPQCRICPVKKLCIAFQDDRVAELPNLGKRETATARRFVAFVVENNGRFFIRQRPAGVVNAHLWEFPNVEVPLGALASRRRVANIFLVEFADGTPALPSRFSLNAQKLTPLCTIKHSITRYRITLEAFRVSLGGASPHSEKKESGTRVTRPSGNIGVWKSPAQMQRLAFTAAHKKLASLAVNRILSGP